MTIKTMTTERHKDPNWLRDQYHGQGKMLHEIADECGVSRRTIARYRDKFGIPRRTKGESHRLKQFGEPAYRKVTPHGYVYAESRYNCESDRVSMHRLLAVSEYGIDAVKGKHVHHKNEIPWDNRPDNLEVMEPGEHQTHHVASHLDDLSFQDEDTLRELYVDEKLSTLMIAERFGCDPEAVRYWLHKHDIETRDPNGNLTEGDK